MSEYWNNGTIIFDRTLTKREAGDITRLFSNFCPYNRDTFELITCAGRSLIEFRDHVTGRGFPDVLNRLADYCKAHQICIVEDSIICFYGDEDGGYDFINGELRCLDADHRALVLCPTEELFDQLFERFKTKSAVLEELEVWCSEHSHDQ